MASEQEQKKTIHSFADEMHHFYSWLKDELAHGEVSQENFTNWFVKQMIRLLDTLQEPYQLDKLTEKSREFVRQRFYIHKGSYPKQIKFRIMLEKFVENLNKVS